MIKKMIIHLHQFGVVAEHWAEKIEKPVITNVLAAY